MFDILLHNQGLALLFGLMCAGALFMVMRRDGGEFDPVNGWHIPASPQAGVIFCLLCVLVGVFFAGDAPSP